MFTKTLVRVAAVAAVTGLVVSIALGQVTIPTVPIGSPGNAPDPFTGNFFGSVAYSYNIGQTEVTNAQYAAFLNAVAATDTYGLYNTQMAGSVGGITRSGSPGSYTYSTINFWANRPVNYVSFWDATRFANWLHNGQPTGVQSNATTEDGAYTLTPGGISANTITRNAGWQWAVTSEDEWYKAAYYQPASAGGDADNYWLYPTSSNSISTGQANYDSSYGGPRAVGSYAANFFGTFDMAGNVSEWNEAILSGSRRSVRGGAYIGRGGLQAADFRESRLTSVEVAFQGFRVSQIPGPSSVAVLGLGGLFAARRRR